MSVEVQEAKNAVKTILKFIGEDPGREGLRDTPDRVIRSWQKLYGGYREDPEKVLKANFSDEGYDQMIMLGPVEFWSTCEHHMIPFYGTVHVGYIPGDSRKVVGVSKLARVIEVYARRLQIQERMTKQIADAVEKFSGASGVGVVVRGKHLCMVARGVEKQQSIMTTSALRGELLNDGTARAEFLAFAGEK